MAQHRVAAMEKAENEGASKDAASPMLNTLNMIHIRMIQKGIPWLLRAPPVHTDDGPSVWI
jgi:hypothetical protein